MLHKSCLTLHALVSRGGQLHHFLVPVLITYLLADHIADWNEIYME